MSQLSLTQDDIEFFDEEPWQTEDLDTLEELEYSANWSTMGCYKTSTGLWLIDRKVTAPGTILIVTSKSGKGTYFDAIPKSFKVHEDWAIFSVGTQNIENLILPTEFKSDIDQDDFVEYLKNPPARVIVLAHYHCFTNKSPMKEILGGIEWDFGLLDEAHKIKNKDTQWTRNIKKLKIKHRHVMTGTGFINRPDEIWSLLNFLDRQKFSSYWRFRRYFCEEENWTGFWRVVGLRRETVEEFRELRKSLGPRRTMQEVHPDIPEPIYHSVEVELNPIQRRMYKEIQRDLEMLDQQGVPIHSPNVLSQLSRLRQISVATPELIDSYYDEKKDRRVQVVKLVEPSSKLDAVMDLLEELDEKQQVVVFSNFKDPLELLKKRLDKAEISFLHMKQTDSERVRYEKWHDLFPQKNHQVFLSTIDLGGESINLSPAQYVVFLDRHWSPAKNDQAISRVWRPGQKGQGEVIFINAKNTVDKRVLDLNNMKKSWFNDIFGEDMV